MKSHFFVLGTLFLLSACAGRNSPAAVSANGGPAVQVPSFVSSPDKGCTSGNAKFRGDFSFSRDQAAMIARAELGKTMESAIQGLQKRYRGEGEVGGREASEEVSQQTFRQLIDVSLHGAAITKTEASGDQVWVQVCTDPTAAAQQIQARNSLGADAMRGVQRRAQDMNDEMDRLLQEKRWRDRQQQYVQ